MPINCNFVGRPHISSWLPGETLFSMASRHHIVACNSTPAETCRQLFGHPRIGSAHDFPARVGYLAAQTQGQLGSPRDIILDHTITRFFFPFQSPKKCANWVAQMTSGAASQLKSQLGLPSARFGAAHPLKACAQCMAEDARLCTVAYWHVEHQIPGVWVCPHHHSLLLTSRKKWSGEDRFGWCLPFDVELVPSAGQIDTSAFDALNTIASSAIALWKLAPKVHLSEPSLASTYR
ncbi:MAG: TniQ family protein [Comamonadaceae bacterium]|nr:TniQ family protein [Comamonadaceae bacterium]